MFARAASDNAGQLPFRVPAWELPRSRVKTPPEQRTAWTATNAAIGELETAASDAVVPGDLRPWCEPLQPLLERTRAAWQAYASEERELLDQILSEDPALSQRVETLREGADRLRRDLDALLSETKELLAVDLSDPDGSAEPTERMEALRKDTLEWIVAARAHHGEVGTWYHEAANRDRGVVD
jgi:hypothetical protein